jgi:putative flavoprotein involved in K+ transport
MKLHRFPWDWDLSPSPPSTVEPPGSGPARHLRGYGPDAWPGVLPTAEYTLFPSQLRPIAAPVLTGTTVTSVRAAGGGYVVRTDQGTWRAQTVVLACGAATLPAVSALACLVPDGITCITPAGYRNPGELPRGGGPASKP